MKDPFVAEPVFDGGAVELAHDHAERADHLIGANKLSHFVWIIKRYDRIRSWANAPRPEANEQSADNAHDQELVGAQDDRFSKDGQTEA